MNNTVSKIFTWISKDYNDYPFGHDDTNFKQYQYVLSESNVVGSDTWSYFNIRMFCETIPGLL